MSDKKTELPEEDIEKPLDAVRHVLFDTPLLKLIDENKINGKNNVLEKISDEDERLMSIKQILLDWYETEGISDTDKVPLYENLKVHGRMDRFFDRAWDQYDNVTQMEFEEELMLRMREKCGEGPEIIDADPKLTGIYYQCRKEVQDIYITPEEEQWFEDFKQPGTLAVSKCMLDAFRKKEKLISGIDKCIDAFEDKRTQKW